MMTFRGEASWAKMASLGEKLTPLACHTTKKVNKLRQLTYTSTNIDIVDLIFYILSRGHIFSHVRPFSERAVSNLDP
jgi:hypothetical protein